MGGGAIPHRPTPLMPTPGGRRAGLAGPAEGWAGSPAPGAVRRHLKLSRALSGSRRLLNNEFRLSALLGCAQARHTHTHTHTHIQTRWADNLEGRGLAGLCISVSRWREPLGLVALVSVGSIGGRGGGGGEEGGVSVLSAPSTELAPSPAAPSWWYLGSPHQHGPARPPQDGLRAAGQGRPDRQSDFPR